jgi:acetoin utilization deacetylase AcuC-like enzyme
MLAAPLQLFYCDHHEFALPPGHKFPLQKYRMVRETLQAEHLFRLSPAPTCSPDDLRRVHQDDYIEDFLAGRLSDHVMRRIGFPWSDGLVRRTLASVGGTLAATSEALRSGLSGTLAGGTHHAFSNEGAGFCVFNDLAVAVEWARQKARISRAAIVDLDVHQGDGTAAIFEDDPAVFTLSLHGASNFPFRKQRSRLDISFSDATTGNEYLRSLTRALEEVWNFRPQLILFQSGVDALASDRLGRLALTRGDLKIRDSLVLQSAWDRHIPLAVTLGGGYSEPISETAAAHAQTFRTAAQILTPGAVEEIARIEA